MAARSENRVLDRTDRKILDILQRDGRISMTELAEQVSLSATPCSERVRRLERDGVITGYHAHLSPEAVGKTLLVFVEIKPDVLECFLVSGSFDYLVKARLGGMREYRRLLGDILKKLPVPAESHSYVVMEEVKETLALPVDR
jgi:Lrp/AsnC family leucine-responsive transcriptional regulator